MSQATAGKTAPEMPADVPRHALGEAIDAREVSQRSCTGCAARLLDRGPGSCPFCGGSLGEPSVTRAPPVDAIVPFRIPPEQARERFRKALNEGWFVPDDLERAVQENGLRAAYLPVWLFGARAESSWAAYIGFSSEEEAAKYGVSKVPIGTRDLRWADVTGTHEKDYPHVTVSASAALPQKDFEAPAELAVKGVPARFDESLLGDALVELPTQAMEDAWVAARRTIEARELAACRAALPGVERNFNGATTVTREETVRLLLVPMYLVAFTYQGQAFRMHVNGQTGETNAAGPLSTWKMLRALGLVLAVLGLLGWAAWKLLG